LSQLNNFFEQAYTLRKNYVEIYNPYEDEPEPERGSLSVYLTDSQRRVLVEMETDGFNALNESLITVTERILDQGVSTDSREKAYALAKEEIEKLGLSVDVNNLAYEIVSSFLTPNLFIDAAATLKAKEDKAAEVVPETFKRGQIIVRSNDIINEEAHAVLEELGLTRKNYAESAASLLGALLLIAVIFTAFITYVRRYFPSLSGARKEALLMFTLYALVIASVCFLPNIPHAFVPILIFTFLISMLLGVRFAIFMNFCVTTAALLVFGGGMDFFVFFTIAGSASALLGQYSFERNKLFLIGAVQSLVNVCAVVGYSLFYEPGVSEALIGGAVYAAAAGVLSIIIAVGSLPFWEAVFGILTPVKLMDLANPNSALLRYMIIEAPGTYQHSLIVANLAETAAYDIGANPLAARAGGYYHDIGKLKYPQYFAENQKGANPHDIMDPRSSAEVILSHVAHGLELADSKKLPKIIRDMVSQHHGTSLIKYFYMKLQKEKPDEEIVEADFRYPGPVPETREAAVVMLADVSEAAVRSMAPTGRMLDEVERFVRDLIKSVLDDGQLENSGLKIKDLDTVASAFMRVFRGMYHDRVPYPGTPSGAAKRRAKTA